MFHPLSPPKHVRGPTSVCTILDIILSRRAPDDLGLLCVLIRPLLESFLHLFTYYPCTHSRPQVVIECQKRGRSCLCSKLPAICVLWAILH